jgi:hypothetical protein
MVQFHPEGITIIKLLDEAVYFEPHYMAFLQSTYVPIQPT